jgi:hypothetical protein
MNREIKFRGKRIDTGEWIYGYIVKNFTNRCFMLEGDDECIRDSLYMRHPRRKPGGSYWVLDKIRNAHERLKDVSVEQDNYTTIIQKYDTNETLFFLDPPYDCKSGKYNGENSFDYDELLNQCRNIKGKFILTLNSGFEDKFKEFYIIPNDVHYSIGCTTGSSKSYKEIIVTNYDINTYNNKLK